MPIDPITSRDTPESRIAFYLASAEARKNGQPLPRPPWEAAEAPHREEPKPCLGREEQLDSFSALTLPSRPNGEEKRAKGMDPRPPGKRGPLSPKTSTAPPPTPSRPTVQMSSPSTAEDVVLPTPPQPEAPQPLLSKKLAIQPPSALGHISSSLVTVLSADKARVVDKLFLCASVPAGRATGLRFIQSIAFHLDDLISKRGIPGSGFLRTKYEIGQHFLPNGTPADVLSVAEHVIRVLEAASAEQLAAHAKDAEAYLLLHVKGLNEALSLNRGERPTKAEKRGK